MDSAPKELANQIEFGVMIETKEALRNIKEIAPLCDCLCYGMNGLTEEIIELISVSSKISGSFLDTFGLRTVNVGF